MARMEYALNDRDLERFWGKVVQDTGAECWHWRGAHFKKTGYACFNVKCADGKWRPTVAHRVSFLLANEYLPPEDTDHLCRDRGCVNPAHLEDATRQVNFLRGGHLTAVSVMMNRCAYGHEFTEENTAFTHGGTRRACRACTRIWAKFYARKKRAGTTGYWTPKELRLLDEERRNAVVPKGVVCP